MNARVMRMSPALNLNVYGVADFMANRVYKNERSTGTIDLRNLHI